MEELARQRRAPEVDHGWAWVIMLAATTWNIILAGSVKGFGILFVEFVEYFGCSPSETSLMSMIQGITMLVLAPFAGRLSDFYSVRVMVFLGGLLASSGLLATAFASKLWVAVLTYGLISGSGIGMMDSPIIATLGKYFDKRRNFANGIAFAGAGIGNFAFPTLFAYLIEQYTISGTMIIIAGIWLHVCIVGALLRPIQTSEAYGIVGCKISGSIPAFEVSLLDQDHTVKDKSGCEPPQKSAVTKSLSLYQQTLMNQSSLLSVSQANLKGSLSRLNIAGDSVYIPAPSRASSMLCIPHAGESTALPNTRLSEKVLPPENLEDKTDVKKEAVVELLPVEHKTAGDPSRDPLEHKAVTSPSCSLASPCFSEYTSLLSNVRFLCIVFGIMFGFLGSYIPVLAIPSYSRELGISKFWAAISISSLGLVETVAKVVISYFCDMPSVQPRIVLIISYVISALAGLVFTAFPSCESLVLFACVHGLCGGHCGVLMSSLLTQCLGVDRLGSAVGVTMMAFSLAVSLCTPISALTKEATGSYGDAIRLSSGFFLLGCVVLSLEYYEMFASLKAVRILKSHCRKYRNSV